MPGKPSAKAKILNAAALVVDRAGAAHLTIDAVAAKAELSKGGVLYHFPSKRAMLEGMVQHVVQQTRERVASHQAEIGDAANSTVRSLIMAVQDQDDQERAMSLAILAAAAENPALLDPIREVIADWFADVEDEGRLGVLLLLATEGIRFLDMLNLLPANAGERSQYLTSLLSMAETGRL
jgi:AcrR family transcriptional regulator